VVFESNMMRVRPDESKVSPQFLLTELNGSRIIDSITKSVKPAVNQASINQGDVLAFSIRVPPIALQAKFAAVVKSARANAQRLTRGMAESEWLFAALQHRAFRGEL
jgi:type I restriction enzyme S subunit